MRRTARFASFAASVSASLLAMALLPLAAVLAGDGTQSSPAVASAPQQISIQVKPRSADAWANTATITPGRIDSPAHIADVSVTDRPGQAMTVQITLKGGVGHEPGGDAVLQFGDVIVRPGQTAAITLSPEGAATGTLISANSDGEATIESGSSSAKVLFRWGNALAGWDSSPPGIAVQSPTQYQQQILRLKQGATPIDNHATLVTLGDLDYTDEQGNHVTLVNQSDAPQSLQDWAASPATPASTDVYGNAYVDMFVFNPGTDHCYRVYDMTAFDQP